MRGREGRGWMRVDKMKRRQVNGSGEQTMEDNGG